jgi:hypothetical protein
MASPQEKAVQHTPAAAAAAPFSQAAASSAAPEGRDSSNARGNGSAAAAVAKGFDKQDEERKRYTEICHSLRHIRTGPSPERQSQCPLLIAAAAAAAVASQDTDSPSESSAALGSGPSSPCSTAGSSGFSGPSCGFAHSFAELQPVLHAEYKRGLCEWRSRNPNWSHCKYHTRCKFIRNEPPPRRTACQLLTLCKSLAASCCCRGAVSANACAHY